MILCLKKLVQLIAAHQITYTMIYLMSSQRQYMTKNSNPKSGNLKKSSPSKENWCQSHLEQQQQQKSFYFFSYLFVFDLLVFSVSDTLSLYTCAVYLRKSIGRVHTRYTCVLLQSWMFSLVYIVIPYEIKRTM